MYFARRAVVTLHIGEPGTFWQGPIPLMLGVVGEVNYLLPFTLFLACLPDAIVGATAGKRLLGLAIVHVTGAPASAGARTLRTLIKTVGFWGIAASLILGTWQLAALSLGLGLIVTLGTVGAALPGGRTLHDRLSTTAVHRT